MRTNRCLITTLIPTTLPLTLSILPYALKKKNATVKVARFFNTPPKCAQFRLYLISPKSGT